MNNKYSNKYTDFWINYSRNYVENRDIERKLQVINKGSEKKNNEKEVKNKQNREKIMQAENFININLNEKIK